MPKSEEQVKIVIILPRVSVEHMPIATHSERCCREATVKKGDMEKLRTVSLGRPSSLPHDDGVGDYCRNRVLVHTTDGGLMSVQFCKRRHDSWHDPSAGLWFGSKTAIVVGEKSPWRMHSPCAYTSYRLRLTLAS